MAKWGKENPDQGGYTGSPDLRKKGRQEYENAPEECPQKDRSIEPFLTPHRRISTVVVLRFHGCNMI
jgi:hypothetical protein